MKKLLYKSFRSAFLSIKYLVPLAAFIAIVYFLNSTAKSRYAKADGRITLLSTTILEKEAIGQADHGESDERAKSYDEWQTIRMRVTAYCPCRKCCGKYSDGKTACGHKIQPADTFVSASSRYPFGTEMIIEGYNNGKPVKVLDRGGAIYGNRLDVFFHSHQRARKWGVKYIDVKVRHKPSQQISY